MTLDFHYNFNDQNIENNISFRSSFKSEIVSNLTGAIEIRGTASPLGKGAQRRWVGGGKWVSLDTLQAIETVFRFPFPEHLVEEYVYIKVKN